MGEALPSPRTLDEVCAAYGNKTPRWMRAYVKEHAIPALRAGRDLLFDDLALRALNEATRWIEREAKEGEK